MDMVKSAKKLLHRHKDLNWDIYHSDKKAECACVGL